MKSLVSITIIAAAMLTSGCVQVGTAGIVPGTTAGEVQSRMGEPTEKLAQTNGDSVWYYAGGRTVRQTYAVQIGSNGVVKEAGARLTQANIRKIVADKTTIKEVRELMGPPYQVAYFPMKKYTSWEYPMNPGPMYDWMILWVNYSEDGIVREVQYMTDPEKVAIESDPGCNSC